MRIRIAFALVAWAAMAPSAGAAQEAPGPEPKADPEQKAEPATVNPKVVVVVEHTRPADATAARDFAAYMTRKLPDKPRADDFASWSVDPTRSRFEYSSCANLPTALKRARDDGAFAVVHVKIIGRRRTSRVNDLRETQASCTLYLPDSAKGGRRTVWRVGNKRTSPNPRGQAPGTVGTLAWIPRPRDPQDFAILANDVAVLVRDAAIELRDPKAIKKPGGGHQVRAEVRNGTPFLLVAFDISLDLPEANGSTSYVVECAPAGGVPPGKQIVTVDVTGDAASILGAGHLQIGLQRFRFQEVAAK